MVTIHLSHDGLTEVQNDAIVVFVEQGALHTAETRILEQTYAPGLSQALQHQKFIGKALQVFAMPVTIGDALHSVILVGLGARNAKGTIAVETYRRAVGKAIRVAEARKDHSVTLCLPSGTLLGIDDAKLAEETTLIVHMAAYHFVEYITDKERLADAVEHVTLLLGERNTSEVQAGFERGQIVADAVNTTRHWIDLPPMRLTPARLASEAQSIAKEHNLKITHFTEKEVIAMGMGGLAGVSSGSDQDCQFVVLEYRTSKANAPTLAFVGKGITFDSGGLSIKPSTSMVTMKDDMSGAAAVITVMKAIAQLQPEVNVVGLAPLSENLPSGKATKPGDILRFYNGKTAEIKDTDAEGRLILADALAYATKHYKPDAIIDVATLTGACQYALGPFFSGMMSQHEELAVRVQRSADRTGDRVWPLPLHDDYKPAVRSELADLSNIGSKKYMAGTITAAFFLKEFVEDTPWVHLDIAGTAFDVPDLPYYRPESATGAAVRLLIDVATSWNKA